jgi:subtilase family serine protease
LTSDIFRPGNIGGIYSLWEAGPGYAAAPPSFLDIFNIPPEYDGPNPINQETTASGVQAMITYMNLWDYNTQWSGGEWI